MTNRRVLWLAGLLLAVGLALIVLGSALGSINEFDHGAKISSRAVASLGPASTSIWDAGFNRS